MTYEKVQKMLMKAINIYGHTIRNPIGMLFTKMIPFQVPNKEKQWPRETGVLHEVRFAKNLKMKTS